MLKNTADEENWDAKLFNKKLKQLLLQLGNHIQGVLKKQPTDKRKYLKE